MKSHYQIHNSTSYQEEYKKYQTGKISHKTLKKNIDDNVFHHMKDNPDETIEAYIECFSKHNIGVYSKKP